jgi:hypothetical protein
VIKIIASLIIGFILELLSFRDDIIALTHIDNAYYYGLFALIGLVMWVVSNMRGK